MKHINETGNKHGRLTVLYKIPSRDKSSSWWHCKCECGKETETSGNSLRGGHTRSCGCLVYENKPNLIHGKANKSRTYRTWKEMRQRCRNPHATQYKWYGGKGVCICERWNDYTAFLADMGDRPENQTLDRINPYGNYEPINCRWATRKQQAQNTRKQYDKRHNIQ